MARINKTQNNDTQVQQVLDILAKYEHLHSNALIEGRRGRHARIYLRIIDPDFALSDDNEGMNEVAREDKVWKYLEKLPNKILRQLSLLVLVTPEEAPHDGPSIEFDDPSPPRTMDDFSDTGFNPSENGHTINGKLPNGRPISVPLDAKESDAVKELASAQGLSDEELLRSWVLEKLELVPTTA